MKNTRFGPSAFVWSLAGLGVLPVLPEIVLAIRANTGKRRRILVNRNQKLYPSLIALPLSHPIYDSSKDLFSPEFRERERRMGETDKIYRGDNPL